MNWIKRNWLYILAFTLPFERIPSIDLGIGSHSITLRASFILALAILSAGLWHVIRIRRLSLSTPDKWLIGYGLVMLASTVVADNLGRSLQVIIATGLLMGLALVIERALHHFELAKLYKYILAAAIIACLFGIYQFLGDSFGLPTAWTGLKDIYTKHVFGFPRVQSVGLEPLFFASFMLLPVLLLITRIYTRPAKWPTYALLALFSLVFALTLSRGGIYGGIIAFIVLGIWLRKYGSLKRLAFAGGSIAIGALGALGVIYGTTKATHTAPTAVQSYVAQTTKVDSTPTSADSDRVVNRKLAVNAFKENPLLGVGIGNFGMYAQTHDPAYANNPDVVVNNEYLEILAETGLAGLVTLLGFAVALFMQVSRAWKKALTETRIWMACITAILIGAAVQFNAFSTLYIIQIWFSIGLLMALSRYTLEKWNAKI